MYSSEEAGSTSSMKVNSWTPKIEWHALFSICIYDESLECELWNWTVRDRSDQKTFILLDLFVVCVCVLVHKDFHRINFISWCLSHGQIQ